MGWITFIGLVDSLMNIVVNATAVAPGFQRLKEWALRNPYLENAQELIESLQSIDTEIGGVLNGLTTALDDLRQRFAELGFDRQHSFEQNLMMAKQFGKRNAGNHIRAIRTELSNLEAKIDGLAKELESQLLCLDMNEEIRNAAQAEVRERQRLNRKVDFSEKPVEEIFDTLEDAIRRIRLVHERKPVAA